MKNYFYPVLILSVFILVSCSKNKDTTPPPTALRVEINVPAIYTDGLDELVVTVFDSDNVNVTANSKILIDNAPITGNIFKAGFAKSYTVKASFNGRESNMLTFNAIRHEVNKFSKKVIIEEFSGMWCSFCTRFTYLIDTMVRYNNNIIPISAHSGDLLEYGFVQQMRNKFKSFDFPSAFVNRTLIWDESAAMLQNELIKKTKCGLAINTTLGSNLIKTRVKVKFDITTSESLSIVVVLLEDSLIFAQSNFYNTNPTSPFYNLGDPIQNYSHNNVMRVAATDIFGDVIPTEVQKKNETWEKDFTINASGYNLSNCKIVAYIQYTENTVTRWGVLNAQVVKAGSIVGFN